MITNDERRRIAAKLRACAGMEYIDVEKLCEAIGCTDSFRGADGAAAVWNRLADLIGPDATSAMTKAQKFSLFAGLCNRDVLQVTYSRSTGGLDGRAYMVKVRHRDNGWERDFYAVDCEALLALARDMEDDAVVCPYYDAADHIMVYALRIREACGEVRP